MTRYCTKCGAINDDMAQYCTNCQAPLTSIGSGGGGYQPAGPIPPGAMTDWKALGADKKVLAGVLGTGQAEPLTQHVQQGLALPDVVGLLGASVDGEVDAHYAAPSVMRRAPRYDSQVQVRVRRAMTPTA